MQVRDPSHLTLVGVSEFDSLEQMRLWLTLGPHEAAKRFVTMLRTALLMGDRIYVDRNQLLDGIIFLALGPIGVARELGILEGRDMPLTVGVQRPEKLTGMENTDLGGLEGIEVTGAGNLCLTHMTGKDFNALLVGSDEFLHRIVQFQLQCVEKGSFPSSAKAAYELSARPGRKAPSTLASDLILTNLLKRPSGPEHRGDLFSHGSLRSTHSQGAKSEYGARKSLYASDGHELVEIREVGSPLDRSRLLGLSLDDLDDARHQWCEIMDSRRVAVKLWPLPRMKHSELKALYESALEEIQEDGRSAEDVPRSDAKGPKSVAEKLLQKGEPSLQRLRDAAEDGSNDVEEYVKLKRADIIDPLMALFPSDSLQSNIPLWCALRWWSRLYYSINLSGDWHDQDDVTVTHAFIEFSQLSGTPRSAHGDAARDREDEKTEMKWGLIRRSPSKIVTIVSRLAPIIGRIRKRRPASDSHPLRTVRIEGSVIGAMRTIDPDSFRMLCNSQQVRTADLLGKPSRFARLDLISAIREALPQSTPWWKRTLATVTCFTLAVIALILALRNAGLFGDEASSSAVLWAILTIIAAFPLDPLQDIFSAVQSIMSSVVKVKDSPHV